MTNRKDYLFKKTKKNKIMSIYKKLFEAKKEIGKISKDSTNPFFKSKYFDINSLLEHVEPILQKHDLLLLQPILSGKVTTRIVDIESDSYVISKIQLPTIQDPQKLGSAITYYRRYTLQSLLGLQAEDDDANTATKEVNALPWLNVGSKEWNGALSKKTSIETLKKYFRISKANSEQYLNELNK
jgi:hypothetical protein